MKYFFYLLLLILSLISCEKENLSPNYGKNSVGYEEPVEGGQELTIFGTWVLTDAKVYFRDSNIVKSHFGSTRFKSSLRRGGSLYSIEDIEKGHTTWTFVKNEKDLFDEFWLNGDSIKPYSFNLSESFMSIMEHDGSESKLGGSARPINVYIKNYESKEIYIYIQEVVDGCNYFSELTFKKQ